MRSPVSRGTIKVESCHHCQGLLEPLSQPQPRAALGTPVTGRSSWSCARLQPDGRWSWSGLLPARDVWRFTRSLLRSGGSLRCWVAGAWVLPVFLWYRWFFVCLGSIPGCGPVGSDECFMPSCLPKWLIFRFHQQRVRVPVALHARQRAAVSACASVTQSGRLVALACVSLGTHHAEHSVTMLIGHLNLFSMKCLFFSGL